MKEKQHYLALGIFIGAVLTICMLILINHVRFNQYRKNNGKVYNSQIKHRRKMYEL